MALRAYCEHCGAHQDVSAWKPDKCEYCGRSLTRIRTKILALVILGVVGAVVAGVMLYQHRRTQAAVEPIYQILKQEPIPLPSTTPFDGDTKSREAYLAGFRIGYEEGLHRWMGTIPLPPEYSARELSQDFVKGRGDGFKLGYRRSLEYERNQRKQ